MGLSLSTGRGATATAFARRAMRRDSFLPAYIPKSQHVRIPLFLSITNRQFSLKLWCLRTWSKWTRTRLCQSLRKSVTSLNQPFCVPSRCCGKCNLEIDLDNSCRLSSSLSPSGREGREMLTVVGDLLIVLDRLHSRGKEHRSVKKTIDDYIIFIGTSSTYHFAVCGSSTS